jgi:phosphoribosylaminoimidazole-succinocarboxamide synthase
VKEAKHYEIDLEWLCCPNSMIPIIEPTLKEYNEDDDEIERQDIDHDNQQEQWHAKKSNVERLRKIAKLRDLPPCPWLDKIK